ncbi:hypothetical protein [Halalkalicoccus subterraneus]|uniref:hypothetical protein n=1 Tax=Halalkalicoccus subterraneus TaxID=2675002 RepID=UPI000EFAB730|nr:hypothetical protein [Halalkalicoccus subterraneus]
MDTPIAPDEGEGSPIPTDEDSDRWRATKYTLPFVALGIFDVVLVIGWGLNPIWGFAILPPILFISVLTWIAFKNGFITEREDY